MAHFRRQATAPAATVGSPADLKRLPLIAAHRPVANSGRHVAATLIALAAIAIVPQVARAQAQQQSSSNPFAGRRLYVDPNSTARRQAETLRWSKPQDAALLDQIANRP